MATTTSSLDKCISLAFKVGLEREQIGRFLNAGYVPQPRQMEFHAAARECDTESGPEYIGYGGTRGQAKSHAVVAQSWLDDMHRIDGLKFLYLRKIQKKAGESMDDLRLKVLQHTPHTFVNNTIRFPNDSFMIMGGFRSESDVDGYLGIEYDGIIIEDATSLTKSKIDMVLGSLRTSKDNWRPRAYLPANPGGVGHAWYKKMFIDPWQSGRETVTRFIHTTLGDNIFINPGYERYLKSLTGWLKKAWCDGDFSISAGQFFTSFSYDVHVREFDLLPHWRVWCALDYGFTHWQDVQLLARDDTSHYYIVDEHAARRWLVPQHVSAIEAMLGRHNLSVGKLYTFVAGHDVFAQRGQSEQTIADQYKANGIILRPANIDRINGAGKILELLGNPEAGVDSRLTIHPRCTRLIECLPRMQHDPNRPEDVLKEDCDTETGEGGDDPYDCGRYGLMIDNKKVAKAR